MCPLKFIISWDFYIRLYVNASDLWYICVYIFLLVAYKNPQFSWMSNLFEIVMVSSLFINAFSRFAAVLTLVSSFYMLAHYLSICLFLPLTILLSPSFIFLFLSFFLSLSFTLPHSASSSLSFCLFLWLSLYRLSIRVSICLYCSAHVLSVCVYVRRAALNNMYYGREWMEL